MKRAMMTIGVLLSLALVLQLSASVGGAGVSARPVRQSGDITIQSWLHANPDKNGLSGTVTAAFKLKGALVDEGGKPAWADATATALAAKAGAWTPVGGYVFVPPVKGTDTTVYAVHTVTGEQGQFFITFSGTYDLVKTYQGSGTWVVTGGTGAYQGVQGMGTWKADASHFPYIRHTEVGQLYFPSAS
jgi:hypothetical protein